MFGDSAVKFSSCTQEVLCSLEGRRECVQEKMLLVATFNWVNLKICCVCMCIFVFDLLAIISVQPAHNLHMNETSLL